MTKELMPLSKELLEEYRNLFGSNGKTRSIKDSQIEHLKSWIEQKIGIDIPYPLYISMGKGGGQKYRILYNVFDINGNAGRRCVFFTEVTYAYNELLKNKHIPLEYAIVRGKKKIPFEKNEKDLINPGDKIK